MDLEIHLDDKKNYVLARSSKPASADLESLLFRLNAVLHEASDYVLQSVTDLRRLKRNKLQYSEIEELMKKQVLEELESNFEERFKETCDELGLNKILYTNDNGISNESFEVYELKNSATFINKLVDSNVTQGLEISKTHALRTNGFLINAARTSNKKNVRFKAGINAHDIPFAAKGMPMMKYSSDETQFEEKKYKTLIGTLKEKVLSHAGDSFDSLYLNSEVSDYSPIGTFRMDLLGRQSNRKRFMQAEDIPVQNHPEAFIHSEQTIIYEAKLIMKTALCALFSKPNYQKRHRHFFLDEPGNKLYMTKDVSIDVTTCNLFSCVFSYSFTKLDNSKVSETDKDVIVELFTSSLESTTFSYILSKDNDTITVTLVDHPICNIGNISEINLEESIVTVKETKFIFSGTINHNESDVTGSLRTTGENTYAITLPGKTTPISVSKTQYKDNILLTPSARACTLEFTDASGVQPVANFISEFKDNVNPLHIQIQKSKQSSAKGFQCQSYFNSLLQETTKEQSLKSLARDIGSSVPFESNNILDLTQLNTDVKEFNPTFYRFSKFDAQKLCPISDDWPVLEFGASADEWCNGQFSTVSATAVSVAFKIAKQTFNL